jgi:hypothetical protein
MEHKAKRLRRSTSTSSPLQVSSCNSSNVTESDTSAVEDYEAVPLTECPYVGLKVDVLDTEKIWASAIIISSKKNEDCNGATATSKKRSQEFFEGEYQVTITYDGWGPEWDETLPYPNSRIVRHFTFSRRVKAFVDIQASKPKYSSSAAPEPMIFWPCQVQVRMPNINNEVAAYFLELEENVYVEPYLPNDVASSTSLPPALRRLFPICQLNDKRDNDNTTRFIPGSWLPTKWLRQFRKFDFGMFSQHQLRSNFPLPGFLSAYEAAVNDPTTPGTLPKRLFLKGSLVNDKYRVWEQNEPGSKYTGEFSDEPNRSTAAAPASSVVNDHRYSPTSSHTGKDPNLPPKLPPSIQVMETLYPTTTKCADSTNYEWFGVITSGGGNDIIVGKFSSQTEAHEAATLAISELAADRQSETDNLKEEENNLNLTAHNMKDRIYEKISNSKKVGSEVITSIETHPLVNKDIFVSTMTDKPTVEEDQNPSAMKKDPNEILSTRNKCQPAPVGGKKTESESSCQPVINRELKTPFGGDSFIGALSVVSKPLAKRLRGSYSVNVPITSEGLLLKVAAASAGITVKEMANFNCTFQGYRKYSDGRPGVSELQNLIRGVGDWIVEVDGESTEKMLLNQTMEMIQGKIEEKRSKNISDLQLVLVDCSSVMPSRKATASSETIDLTLDDDVNRSEQDTINNLKATDESSNELKSSATNFELDKSNYSSQACNDDYMNNLKAAIEPADFVGAYTVYIPITTEGIPLNIGPPSEVLKNELPHFSCIFQGYIKKSNGQKSVTELQNIIHGIGDWIIAVDGESMKDMSFEQVMQIIMGKTEEKRSKNISELQITLVDCSSFNSRGTAIASPGLIDLTLDDDDESNYKNGAVAFGSNMDVEIGKVNNVIQTTNDEKYDDLQTAVEHSDIELNRDNINLVNSHFNADDQKATTRNELDSALTKTKDFTASMMVKSLIREHAEAVVASKELSCLPQSKADIGISTSQKSLFTDGNPVATENETDIVCDSTFGSKSGTEAQDDIIELSSDTDTVLKTRDLNWKQGEEEAFTDESTSSANRKDILTEKAELPPGGLETTSVSNVEESSSSIFQVTQGKIQRDSAQLSIDDYQLPPILARKVKIGNGSEEDLQKISLEAVVTAAESMFNPSLHTFSMQEWTIELIRHKAYLKEVNLGAERSDYRQAMKFSVDDAKMPYDYSRMPASAAHNTGSSFHARKQRKPRKLLV